MIWSSFKAAFSRGDEAPIGGDPEQGRRTYWQQEPTEPIQSAQPVHYRTLDQPQFNYTPPTNKFERNEIQKTPAMQADGDGERDGNRGQNYWKNPRVNQAIGGTVIVLVGGGAFYGVLRAFS